MKHNTHSQPGNHKSAGAVTLESPALSQSEADFSPSADEVARKAYFAYVNQGALPGHDVQHWLAAESELIAERNLTRVHGFHNKT